MKSEDLLAILAGGILAYVAYKTFAGKSNGQTAFNTAANAMAAKFETTRGMYSRAVNNTAALGQEGYGWKYYDNGTAISPNGDYYLNGELVWSAP